MYSETFLEQSSRNERLQFILIVICYIKKVGHNLKIRGMKLALLWAWIQYKCVGCICSLLYISLPGMHLMNPCLSPPPREHPHSCTAAPCGSWCGEPSGSSECWPCSCSAGRRTSWWHCGSPCGVSDGPLVWPHKDIWFTNTKKKKPYFLAIVLFHVHLDIEKKCIECLSDESLVE